MKKAIITGATGMLGATLARELLAGGVTVLAIARRHSAKLGNLPRHEALLTLEADLDELSALTPETVAAAGGRAKDARFAPPYDCWFHFAWDGTYGRSREDLYTQESNVRHTLDAVTAAARLGCTHFVGAGTQAEYGRVARGVKLAPDTPVHPVGGYGAAKLSAGLLGALHAQSLGMAFAWVRVVSVYGPMDNEFTVTISTIRKLLRGEHAAFTNGDQQWDFLYSEDAARAFRLIGEHPRSGAVYVLGSGETIRLSDAFATLAGAVSPDADYRLGELPYRPDQCMYLCADLEALTAAVGFSPQIGYAEGIRRTVAWCRSHPGRGARPVQ